MKRHFLIALVILTCSSCATILNRKTTQLEIITNSPATVIMDKDTLKNLNNKTSLEVLRQRKPLSIVVFNDSIVKNVTIDFHSSFAYWANLGVYYGLGMLIDRKNPKRYAYPKTVYLDMKNDDNMYTTLSNKGLKNRFILKLTPLKLIGIANPGIELSCERGTGDRFATQVMASYLLPAGLIDAEIGFKPNIKGYRIAFEEKYYLKKFAPLGSYLGLEFNHMQNRYQDIVNFRSYNYLLFPFSTKSYSDTIGIKKKTYSFHIKFGHQFVVKKVLLDVYAGLGLRYKDVRHFDVLNPNDEIEKPRHPPVFYIGNKAGKYWTMSVPLSFRIGWLI